MKILFALPIRAERDDYLSLSECTGVIGSSWNICFDFEEQVGDGNLSADEFIYVRVALCIYKQSQQEREIISIILSDVLILMVIAWE